MDISTVFSYENSIGRLEFRYGGAFWIADMSGISSVDVTASEAQSADQIGGIVTSQSVQARSLTVNGSFFEPLDANRKRLIEIMAPQIESRLTMIEKDRMVYVDVVPTRTPEISLGSGVQTWQVQLKAAYPYWRTAASYAEQVAGLTALFKFPFNTAGTWSISQRSDRYYRPIINHGNVPIEFTAIFSASAEVVNPELFHMGTRQRIGFNYTMTARETLTVRTISGQKGVTLRRADGTSENAFRRLSLASTLSMALLPGENLLQQGADDGRENLTITIHSPQGVYSGV